MDNLCTKGVNIPEKYRNIIAPPAREARAQEIKAIADKPPAKPSKPSIKLNALVTPTIQAKVIRIENISLNPNMLKNGSST